MPNTFFGLDIGKTGLYTAQGGLNTTAHNIANVETKGFTRQIVEQKAGNALRTNGRNGMIGVGVDIVQIKQTRSDYYDTKYRNNNSLYGGYASKENYMSQIEGYLNEIQLQGFNTTFDSLYDTLQELQKDPANLTVRNQVMNVAQSFCEYFNSLYTNLQAVQEDCNFEIKNQISRVNAIGAEIAALTKQINTVEVGGSNANDLRDQRNLLVDELSELINVTVEETPNGPVGLKDYVVKIDGQKLVDTYVVHELSVEPRQYKANQTDVDGLYDVVWDNGQQFNPYAFTQTGSIKALFEVRDGNNSDNLKGVVSASVGDEKVTLNLMTVQDEVKLNIPEEGEITIGTVKYEYSSFEVKIAEDGTYTCIFTLNPDKENNKIRLEANNEPTSVGVTVDYKGIPYYMAQINEFLRTYARKFNEIHKTGTDLNGEDGIDFFVGANMVSGEEYSMGIYGKRTDPFTPSGTPNDPDPSNPNGWSFDSWNGDVNGGYSYYHMTAQNIRVNAEIQKDGRKLAAALPDIDNGIGNYVVAERLLALKKDTSMFRQGKPSSYLQTLVAEVGIDSQAAKNFALSQNNLVRSIDNQRLSIAGVDTEEEGMNLMRYQQAYNLSAKVISVMNETYDRLINYMGV